MSWGLPLTFGKVDNDLVRNILIINHNIEQTLLIENRDKAVNIQLRRIRSAKQIYAMKDDRRGGGIRLGYSASGAETNSPFDGWSGHQRMQTNTADYALYAYPLSKLRWR